MSRKKQRGEGPDMCRCIMSDLLFHSVGIGIALLLTLITQETQILNEKEQGK